MNIFYQTLEILRIFKIRVQPLLVTLLENHPIVSGKVRMEMVSKIEFCFARGKKNSKNVKEKWQKFVFIAKIHCNLQN